MTRFEGIKCASCCAVFSGNDEIVVCPDCGAPYHRGCFNEAGHCLQESLHENGDSYILQKDEPQVSMPEPNTAQQRCQICGTAFSAGAARCERCGNAFRQSAPEVRSFMSFEGTLPGQIVQNQGTAPASAYGGENPEAPLNGSTVAETAVFVGGASGYYIKIFRTMERLGKSALFHFSAFFFNYIFCFYRKMYLLGSLLLVFSATVFATQFYAVSFVENGGTLSASFSNFLSFLSSVELGVRILFAFFANKLYMDFVRGKIQKTQDLKLPKTLHLEELSKKGGVSHKAAVLSFALFMIITAAGASLGLYLI